MRILPAVAFALFAAVTVASAGTPAPAPSASIFRHAHLHAWQPPVAGFGAALRAVIDPETGRLTTLSGVAPDASDLELAAARSRELALSRLQPTTRADGSQFILLNGLLQAYTVVRLGPNGRLVLDCADGETEALRLYRTPLAPTPVAEER